MVRFLDARGYRPSSLIYGLPQRTLEAVLGIGLENINRKRRDAFRPSAPPTSVSQLRIAWSAGGQVGELSLEKEWLISMM